MSHRSIEQALGNLLPTHADDLPDELVKLATNLLAQSRSYGSSLKPEEEIARPYACAAIACKRLTKTLRLPATVGRPPCPPRIYKKLYTYLEQALSKASAGSKRQVPDGPGPTTRRTTAAAGVKSPTKRGVAKGQFSSNSQAKSGRTGLETRAHRTTDAPTWTMPVIRRICKTLSTRSPGTTAYSRPSISTSFPPHIFAGLSSILSLVPTLIKEHDENDSHPYEDFFSPLVTDNPKSEDKEYRERIITLAVAIYFVVLRRSQNTQSTDLNLDAFVEMARAALASVGLTEDKFARDVDIWLANILQDGLVEGQDWFKNLPRSSGGGGEEGTNARNEDDEDEEDEIVTIKKRRMMNRKTGNSSAEINNGGLLPGLGTMMSDRLDWLNEDRRSDYLKWKETVMERIEVIERRAAAS